MTRIRILLLSIVLLLSLGACQTSQPNQAGDIEATLQAHDEWLSYLSTQVRAIQTTPLAPGSATPTPYQEPLIYTATPAMEPVILYPPGARSGLSDIDPVIDAIVQNDLDARRSLTRFLSTDCTHADGLGGPPKCNPDQEEGTIVEVFPLSGPEGHFATVETIDDILTFTVEGLFAVYHVQPPTHEESFWPSGEYGLIFVQDQPNVFRAITVRVESGAIVRLDYHIDESPFDILARAGGQTLLAPITISDRR